MIVACALNFVVQGIIIGVQALAFFRYDADAKVVGYLFGAFGIGALCGALVAQRLARKADLLKLAAFAIVAMPLPLFLLAVPLPWALQASCRRVRVLLAARERAAHRRAHGANARGAAGQGDDGCLHAWRRIAGPLGFLAAGEALRYVSLSTFFLVLSVLMTLGGLAFATVLLRNSSAPAVTSVPDVVAG